METKIVDGNGLSQRILRDLRDRIDSFRQEKRIRPCLAAVQVGENPESNIYLSMKERAAEKVGIKFIRRNTNPGNLREAIRSLNQEPEVHGILVQLPLTQGLEDALSLVSPSKDIDGFHPLNFGNTMSGTESMIPCTPAAIIRILEEHEVDIVGKHAVIVNHSRTIGRPLSALLLNRGATVTVCHDMTSDLASHTNRADILVTATGVPGLIRGDMVKKGSVVIDAGICRTEEKICGDAEFGELRKITSLITPVPGGVGPMTVAMAMENTFSAARASCK